MAYWDFWFAISCLETKKKLPSFLSVELCILAFNRSCFFPTSVTSGWPTSTTSWRSTTRTAASGSRAGTSPTTRTSGARTRSSKSSSCRTLTTTRVRFQIVQPSIWKNKICVAPPQETCLGTHYWEKEKRKKQAEFEPTTFWWKWRAVHTRAAHV